MRKPLSINDSFVQGGKEPTALECCGQNTWYILRATLHTRLSFYAVKLRVDDGCGPQTLRVQRGSRLFGPVSSVTGFQSPSSD